MSQSRIGRGDRRIGRRLFLQPPYPEVVMTHQGGAHVAQILDLSEGGLRVALRDVVGSDVQPGQKVALRLLSLPTAQQEADRFAVKRSRQEADGSTNLTILAEDDVSRAKLWLLLETLAAPTDQRLSRADVKDLPKIPGRGDYSEEARVSRLAWLSQSTGSLLGPLQHTQLSAERLSSNIENMIGSVEVPVGVAGPLRIHGQHARGVFFAPMATTEGALVASTTRGATALSRSGGVTARFLSQRMMRVPSFTMSNLRAAVLFASWIRDHVDKLRIQSQRVSKHAKLKSVEPSIIGNLVNVSFVYETGDAAGQNMTTSCTWACCQWLIEQMKHIAGVDIEGFYIEANMSGDKKVNYQSFLAGRGIRVIAEATIPGDVLEEVLKVTPEQMAAAYHTGLVGSVHIGMVGFNFNVANVIAAMFTATGQDIACVHECSVCQVSLEVVPEGIHASVILPSLIVGTVGGGTHLPAQRALLEMMGCAGAGGVAKLAEIIASFCLALDLSTVSAVASGQFASAHERLGRNRPVQFLTEKDLTPLFFTPGVRRVHGDDLLEVRSAVPTTANLGSSIITDLSGRGVTKTVGFFPYRLTSARPSAVATVIDDVLVKVKPLDDEVILVSNKMASMCGPRVANAYNKAKSRTGFKGCHTRELAIYRQTDPRFVAHVPRVYETFENEKREAYVLVLEHLKDVTHLDLADDPSKWTPPAIEQAILGISEIHAIWLGREAELLAQPWIGEPHTSRSMHELRDLWDSLATHASTEFPELITHSRLELLRRMIRAVGHWWSELEQMPRTLIHGDFNPRNICLRDGQLCAYDWELATVQVPQRDIAELFVFLLPKDISSSVLDGWIGFAHEALERSSGRKFDPATYRRGMVLALRDFAISRLLMYLMANTFKRYRFLARVVETTFGLLEATDTEPLPELAIGASATWPIARPPTSRP